MPRPPLLRKPCRRGVDTSAACTAHRALSSLGLLDTGVDPGHHTCGLVVALTCFVTRSVCALLRIRRDARRITGARNYGCHRARVARCMGARVSRPKRTRRGPVFALGHAGARLAAALKGERQLSDANVRFEPARARACTTEASAIVQNPRRSCIKSSWTLACRVAASGTKARAGIAARGPHR